MKRLLRTGTGSSANGEIRPQGYPNGAAACAELAQQGVVTLSGPVDRPWGMRIASLLTRWSHLGDRRGSGLGETYACSQAYEPFWVVRYPHRVAPHRPTFRRTGAVWSTLPKVARAAPGGGKG